jgi:hypothetical protein
MTNPVEKQFFAANGIHHENFATNGATVVTGSFYGIYVYAAATFTTLTHAKSSGDALTSISFPAGTLIPGPITAFTLSAGGVFGLKNEPAL